MPPHTLRKHGGAQKVASQEQTRQASTSSSADLWLLHGRRDGGRPAARQAELARHRPLHFCCRRRGADGWFPQEPAPATPSAARRTPSTSAVDASASASVPIVGGITRLVRPGRSALRDAARGTAADAPTETVIVSSAPSAGTSGGTRPPWGSAGEKGTRWFSSSSTPGCPSVADPLWPAGVAAEHRTFARPSVPAAEPLSVASQLTVDVPPSAGAGGRRASGGPGNAPRAGARAFEAKEKNARRGADAPSLSIVLSPDVDLEPGPCLGELIDLPFFPLVPRSPTGRRKLIRVVRGSHVIVCFSSVLGCATGKGVRGGKRGPKWIPAGNFPTAPERQRRKRDLAPPPPPPRTFPPRPFPPRCAVWPRRARTPRVGGGFALASSDDPISEKLLPLTLPARCSPTPPTSSTTLSPPTSLLEGRGPKDAVENAAGSRVAPGTGPSGDPLFGRPCFRAAPVPTILARGTEPQPVGRAWAPQRRSCRAAGRASPGRRPPPGPGLTRELCQHRRLQLPSSAAKGRWKPWQGPVVRNGKRRPMRPNRGALLPLPGRVRSAELRGPGAVFSERAHLLPYFSPYSGFHRSLFPDHLVQRFFVSIRILFRPLCLLRKFQLFYSFFKTLVGQQVTVELKNDLAIRGVLVSVDQFLNIKLDEVRVVEESRYPHMMAVKNGFIRGSVVRYVHIPAQAVDTALLQDAARRESQQPSAGRK
ncbi:MAG: hypothetical protein BJ554DRAFT_1579 [Olpidium bornovanus]|uniref:Sm domain-containing protein n=1 Tax=Olpidium bornovanus TaxID=278681 RepID=A0A8H7ZRU4_9FUNG|nr:MAG: hypothetical protein BJ554DRAFT_1579 [Olpidium bornovanus]